MAEDFTTWTETDGDGVLTVTAPKVEMIDGNRDSWAKVVKDYGSAGDVGAVDDEWKFEIYCGADTPWRCWYGWYPSDPTTRFKALTSAICIRSYLSSATLRLGLYWVDSISTDNSDTSVTLSDDTLYYVRVKRTAADDFYAYIYSDSGYSTLVDTLYMDFDAENPSFEFAVIAHKFDTVGDPGEDGYLQNLVRVEGSGLPIYRRRGRS